MGKRNFLFVDELSRTPFFRHLPRQQLLSFFNPPRVFFQQKRIQILEADFLTQPLPDCDLLFIPATCLSDTSIERITHSINISKHKPILISSSLNIKANDYSLYKEVKLAMSWGFCRVYISRPI